MAQHSIQSGALVNAVANTAGNYWTNPFPAYGYARVSTDDQTPALQLAALKKDGCKTIFKDKGLSGATTKRPTLLRCLKTLEPADTLTVWKLDRLGRSLRDLITMPDDSKKRGVKSRSPTERSLISERTRAGVKDARRRGVKVGRKPKLTALQIELARKHIERGEDRGKVAESFRVNRTTLYRALAA